MRLVGVGSAACLQGVRSECDAGHSRHVFWKYEAPTQLLRARAHAGGVYSRLKGLRPMPSASGLALGGVWNSCPARVLGRLRGSCPSPALGGMWRQLAKTACGAAAAARRNKEDARWS